MPDINTKSAVAGEPGVGIRCLLCPDGSVCLRWHRMLSLQLDYRDVVDALECLDDVFDNPTSRLSLGGSSFFAFHAGDECYYLLCRDHLVLRLSENEAKTLCSELSAARVELDRVASQAQT